MLLFAGLSNKHKAADLLGGERVREREREREKEGLLFLRGVKNTFICITAIFTPQGSKNHSGAYEGITDL